MAKLRIKISELVVFADTLDENPKTIEAILKKLPIKGKAKIWGEEIYFFVPFAIAQEHAKIEVNPGEIGFWPEGPGITIFFGKTPVSKGEKPAAYSPVNVFAKIRNFGKKTKEELCQIKQGAAVSIELAE